MNEDGDRTLPLWRYPLRWLTFYRATDRWSFLSGTERRQRRLSWPMWRRAVRPFGLGLFWISALLYLISPSVASERHGAVVVLLFVMMLPILTIGLRGWIRDGRREYGIEPPPEQSLEETIQYVPGRID